MEYTKDVDSNLTMIFLVKKGPSPFIGNNQYTLLKYIANNAGMYTGKETKKNVKDIIVGLSPRNIIAVLPEGYLYNSRASYNDYDKNLQIIKKGHYE